MSLPVQHAAPLPLDARTVSNVTAQWLWVFDPFALMGGLGTGLPLDAFSVPGPMKK